VARPRKQHPWRENIEAITMAIAVALLFKTFVLEVSKIPSGSMQPTLMGSPRANVTDRVLVDKLSFAYRDPQRFEIVVFKHPLERSRVMVKRLVGMPEEELRIQHGDLWTRSGDGQPWTIVRRPASVMEEMWRRLDTGGAGRSLWEPVSGEGWRANGAELIARGDGRARYKPAQTSVVDHYADGYPPAVRETVTAEALARGVAPGRNPVGDLRLAGRVRALAGTALVSFELTEGLRTYEFRLPGPAAGPEATVELEVRDSAVYGSAEHPARHPERRERGPVLRLEADETTGFAVENLDDVLSLELGGEVVLTVPIEPADDQRSTLAIAVRGAGAEFERLEVSRDIYYVPQDLPRATVKIPPEHYFMLGDNTLDSADGRDWKSVRLSSTAEDGTELKARGNYRARGENPGRGKDEDGVPFTRFRDEWGNVDWIPSAAVTQDLEISAPLVPRRLIQGRALAVFWPILPHRGIVRLGWLR
jgi:signal peptidase I